MPILDDIKNKASEASQGLQNFGTQHPDASRALLAALASGAVGGGISAMSKREFNETRSDKRKRTIRNALLAAGLGGGATAALQAGAHQFANAVPADSPDPVAAGITRGRELAGGAVSSLPVQAYVAHNAVKMFDGKPAADNLPPQAAALEEIKQRLTAKGTPPEPAGFQEWLQNHSDKRYARMGTATTANPKSDALYEQAKNEFRAFKEPASAALQKAIQAEKPTPGTFKNFLNQQFAGQSVFDNGGKPSHTEMPSGARDRGAVQDHIKNLAESGEGGLSEFKSLMDRGGVKYDNNPMRNFANKAKGVAGNFGIGKHPATLGTSPKLRGAAGLAGGLLVPGLVSNLMKGEFNARDYLPDIPFVGKDDPFSAAVN